MNITRCLAAAVALSLGCSEGSPTLQEQVQVTAAEFISCDGEMLAVHEAGSDRPTAVGCGQKLAFECAAGPRCCPFVFPGVEPEASTELEPDAGVAAPGEPTGSLSKEGIRQVVRASIAGVRGCYERALSRLPELLGVAEYKFIIAPQGCVGVASLYRSSLDDAALEDCIRDHLLGLQFDPPAGGGVVEVRYPFVLTSSPASAACRGGEDVSLPDGQTGTPKYAPGCPLPEDVPPL